MEWWSVEICACESDEGREAVVSCILSKTTNCCWTAMHPRTNIHFYSFA